MTFALAFTAGLYSGVLCLFAVMFAMVRANPYTSELLDSSLALPKVEAERDAWKRRALKAEKQLAVLKNPTTNEAS